MIAVIQGDLANLMNRAMDELISRRFAAEGSNGRIMANLAKTNEASEIRQRCNLCLQEGRTLGDLGRFWLIGRWRTLDRIGDHHAPQRQPVACVRCINTF
jgi:hypothetical protein